MTSTIYETFLLHSRADRNLRSVVSSRLEKHGITMMEWLVLSIIAREPKRGFSMSNLAAELDVTLPQITALITNLSDKRLVKLRTNKQDRRSRHANLTKRGEDLLDDAAEGINEARQQLFSDIQPAQQTAYKQVLKKLSDIRV